MDTGKDTGRAMDRHTQMKKHSDAATQPWTDTHTLMQPHRHSDAATLTWTDTDRETQ